MGLGAYLRANRARIEDALADSPRRRDFSPVFYVQYRAVLPLMAAHLRGAIIDLGCGHQPFRQHMPPAVTTYHALDYEPRVPGVTYTGDIQAMPQVPSAHYDGAICFEVLEHVPEPARALAEIQRVLKPGGVAILSVPHLSRLHEEPHDYGRFTIHGLRYLLTQAGFEIELLQVKGGLFAFLGHQISTVLLTSTWSVPVLRQIAWILNKWAVTRLCVALDDLTDKSGVFALGYVALVRKAPALQR